MDPEQASPDIIDRLRQHRIIGQLPDRELAWLAARGRLRRFEAGECLLRKGQHWESQDVGLEFLLSGRIANYVERSSGSRKAMEWQAGDVTGVLPFSRMGVARGTTLAETAAETFSLDPEHFPELIRECPGVTAACVHVMIDRARVFRTTDLQDEKMVSLGKLSAGLAHELNNPASAVARSAGLLQSSMGEADR
ncbi:MAG: ATP-binding protein, partial [Candidatus Longimicrobiales bacterium M2_2A_002]